MNKEIKVPLSDLIICLSNIMDLINPKLFNHHRLVAYIASNIAEEMDVSSSEQSNIIFASLIHDCGALNLRDKINALEFDFGLDKSNRHQHSLLGSYLLQSYKPFNDIASIVKYHHVYWDEITQINDHIPLGSKILHLSDRVEILINRDKEILGQSKDIISKIEIHSGKMFCPQVVEAFKNVAAKESFWFYLNSPFINSTIPCIDNIESNFMFELDDFLDVSKIIHKMIDYRSVYSASHSAGVSITSTALAEYFGFSKIACKKMKIAGLLHDMGKLAVPSEILDKQGPLTTEEFNIVKMHTFYSHHILSDIKDIGIINEWISYHHEKLDGTGYPFRKKENELSLGTKIMAVADVFTALTENRPYRSGMTINETLRIIEDMANLHHLDKNVVITLKQHIENINFLRLEAQNEAYDDYHNWRKNSTINLMK